LSSVGYAFNVFINCPFDDAYRPLLRAILFCLVDCGFAPRIALERGDGGEARIEKIYRLIEESQYAIHDLSRIRAAEKGELFRLNMPFELGLDIGCRRFGGPRFKDKRCLILEKDRYVYQAALSDIAGSDIRSHANDAKSALTNVRSWLAVESKRALDGPERLWMRFNEFMTGNVTALKERGFTDGDIEQLEVAELIDAMQNWRQVNPA
jgi:hypothetical protein